jgi:ribosomal protein S18 acetylase RimI-like enzyme
VEHTDEGVKRLYIMTLAVLAAYRGREIGTQLFRSVLDYAVKNDFTEIALHVQISNNDAIRFYTEKFGFQRGPLVENYYRRIDPPHCYLLYKNLDSDVPNL